jgi:hypothetical protein
MFTYAYERQDIIQIALKRVPGGRESAVKKVIGLTISWIYTINIFVSITHEKMGHALEVYHNYKNRRYSCKTSTLSPPRSNLLCTIMHTFNALFIFSKFYFCNECSLYFSLFRLSLYQI